jgi:hypothetical protein
MTPTFSALISKTRKRLNWTAFVFALSACLPHPGPVVQARTPTAPTQPATLGNSTPGAEQKQNIQKNDIRKPLRLEPNQGQAANRVHYLFEGQSHPHFPAVLLAAYRRKNTADY